MNRRIFWVLILLINSFLSLSNTFADDKAAPANQDRSKPRKAHPLALNLAKIGAFSCAERADQIGNFLTGSLEPELVIQTPKDNPNNRLLMSSMIYPAQDKQSIVGSISLAPNQANGCGGSYHTVSFSNQVCSKTILEKFPNIKFQAINNSNVQIGVVNRALWIFAIPADKGCIFVKEEIIE